VVLPPDFTPFSPDINETTINFENQQQPENNNNHNDTKVTHQDTTKSLNVPGTPTAPIFNRRMFSPQSPSTNQQPNIVPEPSICRSTRSNFGNTPVMLDPSNHLATNYNESAINVSPVEHYCTTLGIKLPTATRGQTISQGGCKKPPIHVNNKNYLK
jgi:hypothetical protein